MSTPDFSPATFEAFYRLGFTRLVPIIPFDAPVSPTSSFYKRVGTDQDPRGKAPGVRGQQGLWYGYDWVPQDCTESDLPRWQAMSAGIGIKTGGGIVAIDADTLDNDHARIIRDTIERRMGRLPCRIGKFPKALYLIAITEPMKYTRVEFGELDDKGRLRDRVEILSDGRQFVAHGIHPGTQQPYSWTRDILPRDRLPKFSPADVVALLEELRTLLPAAKPLITEGATTEISQGALKGSLDKVRQAVAATPNNSKLFGTREAYRDFGYAIKAALPDNEPEAFELFSDWCARWQDGVNDPDVVAADWRRMKGPYRRGANWLYETAETTNPEAFKKVDVFFDKIEVEESIFGNESSPPPLEAPEVIKWVDPKEWEGKPKPIRKFIIGGMVPDGEVTLLTGAGGVGKTLLAQQAATCVALGLPFLGRETIQCKVMMFLCEDSEDELHLRQQEINLALGAEMPELSAHVRIASRKYMDNLLTIWDRNTGAMKRAKVWQALRDDALAFGAKLIVVDTIADTFGGSEIDRSQVRQFIQACLGKLAQEIGGAVLALGHPSKAGQAAGGDGTSGSTAWHASVRSRLYLQHATKDGSGPFRRLENKKANYGPAGDVFMLRWLRGAFELVTTKSTAPEDGATGGAPDATETVASAIARLPSMGNVIDDAIMAVLPELAGEGVALSDAHNSPHWAPKVLKRRSSILGIYTVDEIEAGWRRVVAAGRARVAVVGRKPNRQPIMGYELELRPGMIDDIFT